MEKEDFEWCQSALCEITNLIIRLAENATIASKVLAGTDLERTYNTQTLCVSDEEVLGALYNVVHMAVHMENGRQWAEHLERNR